jgi:hypothetical protein
MKFIPVENNVKKAIAFANTLDNGFITNVQKIKQKEHYIKSMDVVNLLQNEGWNIAGVDELRNKRTKKITDHYIQFHHNDFQFKNSNGKTDAVASLTLSNSCDGSKPLELDLGAYRLVCSNGAISYQSFANEKFKHIEIDYNQFLNRLQNLNDKSALLLNDFEWMKGKQLNQDQIREFATRAAELRYGKDLAKFDINSLLNINRVEDIGDDLYLVMNVIQENITKDLRNRNQDINLNKRVMELAYSYSN